LDAEAMPTYDYQCPTGHEFEKFHAMSDRTRVKCPRCGKVSRRQISGGAGLHFKGSGFYITDYGKDGKGPRQAEEKAPKVESAVAGPGTGPEKKAEKAAGASPAKKATE
jgi:putative FmdB family regulatory protein